MAMEMRTIAAAFLRDIIDHPTDCVPRLIYADWLEDQGGEEDRARAEFIRVQVELWRRGCYRAPPDGRWRYPIAPPAFQTERDIRLLRREKDILTFQRADDWSGLPLDVMMSGSVTFGYRCGFVEVVRMPAAMFIERCGELRGMVPLAVATLTDPLNPRTERLLMRRYFEERRGTSIGVLHSDIYKRLWPGLDFNFCSGV